jgi:anti-anti-sigma regulatory factor
MAMDLTVGVDGSTLLVALTGELGLREVAPVRLCLLKCLAEQPDALLVDLAGMTVGEPLALSVFVAVARQAARWPGTPVLFCGPPPAIRRLMRDGAYQRLPLFASADAARQHVGPDRRILPSISDDLLPVSGAARQARNVATDACLRWDLPHLVAPASLIVSELVSNVVDHAHTMMTLRLSLRRRYLNMAVRDGSSAEPAVPADVPADVPGGRGLFLVNATAHTWGWLPADDGKVVWAALAR